MTSTGWFPWLVGLCLVAPVSAQRRDSLAITAEELGARLLILSSDRFEGRYPGTRGERLTTDYLISVLDSFQVQPAVGGKWLQPVSIVVHDPVPGAPVEARLSGRVVRNLEHGRDLLLGNYTDKPDVRAGGELVFVGYGIYAPQYDWDDFAGIDLRDKIAILLIGEPSIDGDSRRFNGPRASRFSRYADKIAELERRGAKGALLLRPGAIPRNPPGGTRRIAETASRASLFFTGSIAEATVASLLPQGRELGELIARAHRPGFRAVPLGVRLDFQFTTRPRTVVTNNVVGTVQGTDERLAGEHIVISSHWDAFGIGRPVNGDSIYNGALDDGSGVTAALALARVFAASAQPRSITFLFTTAEEWGLIGAEAFVCQGPLPSERIIANLNLDDGTELFGPKRDVAPLGIELSTLGETIDEVAFTKDLGVSLDPFPEEGFFLRADNFPFARAGIPSLYMALGTEAVGKPDGWMENKVREYLQRDYHRPSDDYATVALDLKGSLQYAEFARDVTRALARARERPTWLPGSEFARPPAAAPKAPCR